MWEDYKVKSFNDNFNCQSFSLLKHQKDEWVVLQEFRFL
jgi:hypothetical protein